MFYFLGIGINMDRKKIVSLLLLLKRYRKRRFSVHSFITIINADGNYFSQIYYALRLAEYLFFNILEWAYLPSKSFWVYYHHLYESDRTPTEEFLLGLQKCWDYLMVKKNKIELFVHISIGKIKFFFRWHCAIGGIIIVSREWINFIFPFVW